MKKKYKYRLILDESLSIGSIGARGAGLTDFYSDQVSVKDVDMIIGSLGHAFGATGGFCAGSTTVIDHQRLGGQAYCFSASLPALLTVFALSAIKSMPGMESSSALANVADGIQHSLEMLPKNISLFKKSLLSRLPSSFEVRSNDSSLASCLIHIQMASNPEKHPDRDIFFEEKILQKVVDLALEQNIYVTRSKDVRTEDIKNLPPSIKLCISGAFSESQMAKLIDGLVEAFTKVDKEFKDKNSKFYLQASSVS